MATVARLITLLERTLVKLRASEPLDVVSIATLEEVVGLVKEQQYHIGIVKHKSDVALIVEGPSPETICWRRFLREDVVDFADINLGDDVYLINSLIKK